jgi:hypothetical protein
MLIKDEVFVTGEDIANGVPGEPEKCPVALALKRVYPDYEFCVGKNYIHTEKDEVGVLSFNDQVTTLKQSRFVKRFDAGKRVEPFSFDFYRPFQRPAISYVNFSERLEKGRNKASKR